MCQQNIYKYMQCGHRGPSGEFTRCPTYQRYGRCEGPVQCLKPVQTWCGACQLEHLRRSNERSNGGQGYGQPPPPTYSSYPPHQQGYGQYQPPPYNAGPPPPNAYGAPPPGGQYGQPPPQQYPPPQQQYGGYGSPAPPPQPGYGVPPPQQYGQPPPGQYGVPPPQPYGQPPPGQYGAPPPGQYGAPPPGQYGAAPQGYPSPGYGQQTAPMDVSSQVTALKASFKGFGTDEKLLIRTIAKQDPIQMNTIREQYNQRFQTDVLKKIESETSGNFRTGLLTVFRGPLMADCWSLYESMKGLGTKEAVLNDVLMGRSNADINAIKAEYQRLFRRPLEADLRDDLSAGTEQLFVMVIAARRQEDTAPVIPQQIEADVTELQRAMGNMIAKDSAQTCQILTSRSDAQLRAITQTYSARFHKSLESIVKTKFSGHMEKALLLLLARANNRAASDAVQLEETMAGLGTRDQLLIQRLVRAHWDQRHMGQVRSEFQRLYKRDLVKRIKGETSGDYERLLVGLAE
ncbi:Annexin [Pleomassaria siparia CBS 279.74]|uniref:Annexin n=1 Tax=Pleomassaria siparia CBS 279.74 TaxID=1314801 RepID=A0A6G1KPX4_9PLEO|nr:Annexin [Pleomassaria siparia CBS 279.74]